MHWCLGNQGWLIPWRTAFLSREYNPAAAKLRLIDEPGTALSRNQQSLPARVARCLAYSKDTVVIRVTRSRGTTPRVDACCPHQLFKLLFRLRDFRGTFVHQRGTGAVGQSAARSRERIKPTSIKSEACLYIRQQQCQQRHCAAQRPRPTLVCARGTAYSTN
jgi:hypothetical protein